MGLGTERNKGPQGLPAGVGVAFQMRDDYIGIFGDEKKSGKTNLDDVHEGKYTMLVAETLPRISTEVAGVVSEMLGNHQVTEVELERLRSIMHGSGAVQRVQDKMEGLIIEATKAAESAESWDEEYGRFLTELLEYSVRRDA